jgi:hypothetical protein
MVEGREPYCRVSGLLELIRIEATLAVASILCSRKPRRPASVSSRVLRHERVGIGRLTLGRGMVMEVSEEPRDASAGRWQAGALPASRGLGCLMASCGRTGGVGVHPVSHHDRHGTGMPLSLYRRRPWEQSRGA